MMLTMTTTMQLARLTPIFKARPLSTTFLFTEEEDFSVLILVKPEHRLSLLRIYPFEQLLQSYFDQQTEH